MQRLPCGEVLQRRSPKDGFKKSRVRQESDAGRHEDICGSFKKWRKVVKDRVAPDPCTADLVAFLQRCPKTEVAPEAVLLERGSRVSPGDRLPGRRFG